MKTDNELIAEFMGYRLTFIDGINTVSGKPKREVQLIDPIGQIRMSTPSTMWGTEEETIEKCLKEVLAPYGYWGRFHTSWDSLMPVYQKFSNLLSEWMNSNRGSDSYGRAKEIKEYLKYGLLSGEILMLHTALSVGIKWYNENKGGEQ
jgi:hypothetical protein